MKLNLFPLNIVDTHSVPFLWLLYGKYGKTYHSIASSRPVPFVAEVLKICHFLSLRTGRPKELATSAGVIAWSISCLFANTNRMAFFSSSSWLKHKVTNNVK